MGDWLQLSANDYVLDLGCGDGNVLLALSEAADCRCCGIDILPTAVERATSLAAAAAARAEKAGAPRRASAQFRVADIFAADELARWAGSGSDVTVLIVFLVPQQLKPLSDPITAFLRAKPGRRVLSYRSPLPRLTIAATHPVFELFKYDATSLPAAD